MYLTRCEVGMTAPTSAGLEALAASQAIREKLPEVQCEESEAIKTEVETHSELHKLTSNNQSIVSIAFLAFGVILFDVLGDALFGTSSNILASLGGGLQGRETLLPGLGIFGDNVNNLAEVVLNMITIYLYRDESPDCGERLLCESNQQAVSRGFLDTLVTYISGFAVSFFLHEAPLSRNLQAMRAGRKGQNCIEIYPKCSITL
ncbi:uncharacterized protein LOC122247551 [Penaeus japonicus]|uniref:uncharacterized protein LOC122247551 n=1 Tax=Penaeus japonicus TaxID=27405 RepID=UPI001C7119AA|nr:uncharacterized protein LOC122247551 [Penaeus japonicus]